MLGDCVGLMNRLEAGSVDFVLTDPLYITRYRDRSGRSVANDDNDRLIAPAFAGDISPAQGREFLRQLLRLEPGRPIHRYMARHRLPARRSYRFQQELRVVAMAGQLGVEFTITLEGGGVLPALGMHVCFRAHDRAAVRAFHAAAIAAGGRDDGAPGPRPIYHRDYYAAFVIDPDGHRIEAVCHAPMAPDITAE